MGSNKKDLTSIEDLGEYEHELDIADDSLAEFSGLQEDEGTSIEPFGGDAPPDLPESDDVPDFNSETSFETDFSSESTDGDEDKTAIFETSNDFESTDFPTTDFSTSDFGTSEFKIEEDEVKDEDEEEEETVKLEEIDEKEEEKEDTMINDMVEETMLSKTPLPSSDFLPPLEEIEESKKEEIAPYVPAASFKQPEEFQDVKKFAESAWSGSSAEGNPSFSVLVKNVRYVEDVNDIVTILKELSLLSDPEDQVKSRLMRGHLLIPRISEFAAIFVAHKLRRFDIDIQVGLSDEIHPPKHQEAPETGVVTKHNLYQNQGHHFHFDDPKLEISQIIVAATPTLEGYQVLRYMGVASEHKMIDGHVIEDDNSEEIPRHYHELAQKLKAHALKANSNAVVGLNYQLTPVPSEYGIIGHKYRLSCTGNLVWVNKL